MTASRAAVIHVLHSVNKQLQSTMVRSPQSSDARSIEQTPDRALTALALALLALSLGYAINIKLGTYAPWAMFWLTVGLVLCLAAVVLPCYPRLEPMCRRVLPLALAISIFIQTFLLLRETSVDSRVSLALATIAFLGFAEFFPLRGLRLPLMFIMAGAFFFAGEIAFNTYAKFPGIDVFNFQATGTWALSHGLNPYSFRYPSVYPPDTPYYGAGVVDAQGMLTVGFPYPPLSLLMVMPAHLIGGDVRYALVIAMGLSAVLMASARPGRIGALAGAVFLLTPRAIYVLDLAWTEPLLVLTFSLTMFCACRWPKGLPWCFGLYLSTKQYAVLAIPLLPLLLDGPRPRKSFRDALAKACLVVAAINLPFFIWNARAFFRSTVEFQLLQPFRTDALSYLVFVYNHTGGWKLPIWTSLPPLALAIALGLRRAVHSPAGFAAAATLVHLAFFAFNKQAFCNYYYFVIATACWSIAAARIAHPFPLKSQAQPT
ncbi:MAG: hypothetical protein ABSB74_17830 [Tepidisphaeraceae bacterium]